MLKRLILTAALMSLVLAGSLARADSQDQQMQRQLRSNFGLVVESSRGDQDEGLTVLRVLPNSLAERAGLRKGDVIRRVGRRTVEELRDLANTLLRRQQDENLVIEVERNGRLRDLRLIARLMDDDQEDRDSRNSYGRANDEDTSLQRLEQRFRRLESRLQEMEQSRRYGQARSDSAAQSRDLQRLQQRLDDLEARVQEVQRSGQYGRNTSGLTLGAQTRSWRRQSDSRQGGSADEGVLVTAIDSESPAADAGLRRGDIIFRVDDRDVSTPQELRQALQRIGAGQETTLEVLRGNRQMMLNIRLEGGSRDGARDRRYERLEERIGQLESRLNDLERNR